MKRFFLALTLVILLLIIVIRNIYAADTSIINATVSLSVCGNNIQESGEDCDDIDLGGNTCATVGYTSGILTCDSSCTFDKTLCILAPTSTPTPTPTATTSPTQTPTPTSTTATSSTSQTTNATATPVPSNTQTPVATQLLETLEQVSLPQNLAIYDTDNSGSIDRQELYELLRQWVDAWRDSSRRNPPTPGTCDIDVDGVCNIRDFSVILYYIRV